MLDEQTKLTRAQRSASLPYGRVRLAERRTAVRARRNSSSEAVKEGAENTPEIRHNVRSRCITLPSLSISTADDSIKIKRHVSLPDAGEHFSSSQDYLTDQLLRFALASDDDNDDCITQKESEDEDDEASALKGSCEERTSGKDLAKTFISQDSNTADRRPSPTAIRVNALAKRR